jgi:hypothetical protein
MGHKYRKKNRLRKQHRQRERAGNKVIGSWLGRVVSDDMARAMHDYWRRQLPWGTASRAYSSTTPLWEVAGPAPRLDWGELTEWGRDKDDERPLSDLFIK